MALSYKTHLTTTIKSQTGWSNHSSNLVFFSLIFSLIPDFACSYFCRTWKICCWKMVSRIVLNGSLPCMSLSDHFNPKFFFQQWLLSDRRICSVLVGQRVQSFVRACDKQRSLIKCKKWRIRYQVKSSLSKIVLSKVDTLRLTPGIPLQLRNGECNGENDEKSSDSHRNDPYSRMEELHVSAITKGIT